jgi:hypothetical protein
MIVFKTNNKDGVIANTVNFNFFLPVSTKIKGIKSAVHIGPIGLAKAPKIMIKSIVLKFHFLNKPRQHNEKSARCNPSVKSAITHLKTVVLDVRIKKHESSMVLSNLLSPK